LAAGPRTATAHPASRAAEGAAIAATGRTWYRAVADAVSAHLAAIREIPRPCAAIHSAGLPTRSRPLHGTRLQSALTLLPCVCLSGR
jgi:hypothetical protein